MEELTDGAAVSRSDDVRYDDLFAVLSHPSRRFVLLHLNGSDGPSSVRDLARQLDAWEAESDRRGSDGPSRREPTSETTLVHLHLPKMAAANVIEYDRNAGRVRLADTGAVAPHLEAMASD